MLPLSGKNLGERQRQLNEKVNEAAKSKIDFGKVKRQSEKSDVDKLFKINLAAKYKNVDYILEIFKCGDSLFISQALSKCTWLCDKDFAHVINNDYLHDNIFPLMSTKMRNKLLTTVATNLKDSDRAIRFYTYCMKIKLYNIALKFLIHTPDSFKMDLISDDSEALTLITEKEGEYLKHFIGNSLHLAENYINNIRCYLRSTAVYILRYLYAESNLKYLDILEIIENESHVKVFGRRLSKHIIQNYKARVMKKPLFYTRVLNKDVISRNCTIEEAKVFAIAVLPENISSSFYVNYYDDNKFVLNLIPEEERFSFIKKIFTEKHPNQAFETCYDFYSCGFYNVMTIQEREAWALKNIASQDEILGSGKDYLWYKFVRFDKALTEIKKYIIKTTDGNTRCEMLNVLLDSVKNEDELTKLLKYYCERHMNELPHFKNSFFNKLVSEQKVLRFGLDCWMALEKILYSLDVFDKSVSRHSNNGFKVLALMYYILHGKPVLNVLNDYIDMDAISLYSLRNYGKELGSEKEDMIFQYILQLYTEKIKELGKKPYEDGTKKDIIRYLHLALNLTENYDKTKYDLPEIVHSYLKLEWSLFKHHSLLAEEKQLSSSDIVHYLKEDAELVVENLPKIKYYVENRCGNINWLLHRLKVYFSYDIAQKYLTFFNECLSADNLSYSIADAAVRGILILADVTFKIEFLKKYTPRDKKIDHANMPGNTFHIQRAICRQMYCSRPPLPLSNVLQYVIGDYVQHCLALFRSYTTNLPYPQSLEFVESIINKPLSIQKHGLRLAFECFDVNKLKSLILHSWNTTKNVSLRMVLYKSLFRKILEENGATQMDLFEVLITITSDLNEDDDETVFECIRERNLPDHLVGRFLETSWNAVSKFLKTPQNLKRMVNIIKRIGSYHSLFLYPEDALNKIIDDHVHAMLDERKILNTKRAQDLDDFIKSKWELTINNLVYLVNNKKLKKNVEVVKHIIKKCVEMWDEFDESGDKYVVRYFIKSFIRDLASTSYEQEEESYSNMVNLFQIIEQDLKKALPEKEIYMMLWNLRSHIMAISITMEAKLCVKTLKVDKQVSVQMRKYGVELGIRFGMLIKSYVNEGQWHWIFFEEIKGIVSTIASNYEICLCMPKYQTLTDVYVLLCLGLLEVQLPETYMFALALLPTEYEDSTYLEDYVNIIKRIQAFQSTELQCYVYEKFVNTDFKPRKHVNIDRDVK